MIDFRLFLNYDNQLFLDNLQKDRSAAKDKYMFYVKVRMNPLERPT